jgi:hypothetical protein
MQVDNYGVHVTHCCTSSCKYGDEDCPVASGEVLPEYKCEMCTCLQMNPGSDQRAEAWWASMTPGQKAYVYLSNDWNAT